MLSENFVTLISSTKQITIKSQIPLASILNVHYNSSLMPSSSSVKADVQEEPQGLPVCQIGVEVICHRDAPTLALLHLRQSVSSEWPKVN